MDTYQIVASTGSATVNCGLSTSTACKSVNTAISNRRPNYLKRIKLLNGSYSETDNWIINSTRGKVDAIMYGSSGNFNLTMTDITISTPSVWTDEFSYSLFYFSSGTLSFSRVATKNIRLATNCLFQMANGVTKATFSFCNFTNITASKNNSAIFGTGYTPKSLALNNCSISSISSLNSIGTNGGVLSLNADDSQISFSNTTFTSCCVSQSSGRGGALYFSTSGSLSKFTISRCQFSLNQALFGRDVFIFVPSLPNANLDSYYSVAATPTYVPNRTNAWYGRDNATFQGDFDLMPFIFGYSSSIIHASNASRGDGKYCGSTVAHCKSITQAVQRFNGSSHTIKANGTVEVSMSGTDVSNVLVERNESTVNATVTIDRIAGNANSALISSGAFKSQNIVYSTGSVPQGSSVQSLLSGTGGTQTFSNCIFVGSASNALTITLVSISGGSLVLESTSFNASSELSCSCSLFSLQNGIFKFSDSRFANLKFTSSKAGLISQLGSGSSSQQIELSNCGFERISSTKETSSCVVISSSTCIGSFNATSCNFSSSSCPASINGGAISFAVGANKKFEISQCKISSNTASESAGKGGGVFLLLKDISSDYKITECSFVSNKAKYGRDIYIQAPNLNSCVTFEKFGNLLTPTTDVENMMYGCNTSTIDQHVDLIFMMTVHLAIVNVKNADSGHGNDWFRCGNESEPCETFEYGMDKILDTSSDNKGISIVTKAVISKPIDLSSMTILSSSSSTPSILSFNFASTTFDAAIINHDILTFNKIKLYLPSVRNVLKALISTESSLIVNDSNFDSEQLNSSVYLNTIEVKGGTVMLNNCSIGERSFCLESSFIKYAGSSTITLNHTSISTIAFSTTFFSETTGGHSTLSLMNASFTRCSASPQTTMSPIISTHLEGTVNFDECNFSNVGNAECKEGGVINIWLKDTGKISISGCQVGECFCNEATGKGGFLYLSKQQSEGQYDLSVESKYSNNKAHIGKNLFFNFDSLNESVSADKLFLPVSDPAIEGGKAYIGKDTIFNSVNLIVFLVQFVSDKVHVSNTGYDVLRCGSEDFPCHSIWKSMKNVRSDSINKEIIFDTLVEVESYYEFQNLTLSAASPSQGTGITICSDLPSSDKDTAIGIAGNTNFVNITFSLPSEFVGHTNAFSGMDTAYFTTKSVDLLAFIVEYNSEKIVVSSSFGADVKGCGKETLPCSSFSTGLHHIINTTEPDQPVTQLLIENSANVDSCFDVSEREIGSLQNTPAGLFIAASISSLSPPVGSEDCVLFNSKTLKLTLLAFTIPTEFTTSQTVLILSSSGVLFMKNCSMMLNQDTNNAISYCLIEVRSGAFEIKEFYLKDLAFDSKPMQFGATDIDGKIDNCQFEGLTLKYPLFSIPETHSSFSGRELGARSSFSILPNGDCILELISCRMNEIIKENGGSCLLSCETINNVKYKMNGCILNGCESKTSARGGSMLFTLGPGNSDTIMFDINGTSLGKCIASTASGKGGGVYLDCGSIPASGRNEHLSNDNPLGFRFKNVRFSFNNASSGRDVFILCVNIESQVTSDQFLIDFDESVFDSRNAIFGREKSMAASERDRDLIDEIRYFRGEQVLVSSNGENGKRCGNFTGPCKTLDVVVQHVSEGRRRTIFIDAQASMEGETDLSEISVVPLDESCAILMNSTIAKSAEREYAIATKENVQIDNVAFIFGGALKIIHSSLICLLNGKLRMNTCNFVCREIGAQLEGSLIAVVGGTLKITESTFSEFSVVNHIISCESHTSTNLDRVNFEGLRGKCFISCSGSTFSASQLTISTAKAKEAIISCSGNSTIALLQSVFKKIEVEEGSAIHIEDGETLITDNSETEIEKAFSASLCAFTNVSCGGSEGRVISSLKEKSIQFINNTLCLCSCLATKGKQLLALNCKNIEVDACVFDGWEESIVEAKNDGEIDEICRWNGSLVDATNCQATIKETSIANSSVGGISLFGGNLTIEKGEFLNNNKSISAYKSARRNIICSEDGTLNIVSLKGGDGLKDNSSLWILQDKCSLEGIAAERSSPFFIPILESVKVDDLGTDTRLTLKGSLLMPCNLFVRLIYKTNEEYVYEKREIDSNGWISENEAISTIKSTDVSSAAKQTELSVALLFGNLDMPSSTSSKVIKNITKEKGNDRIVEGTNKATPSWVIIALVVVGILLFIAALCIIVVVIRWRKEKRRSNQLEVMVEQTTKENPKEIEMLTYGFGAEEEPCIRCERASGFGKQRNQANKLAKSESQQSLLTDVGSTQEILLDHSDEIPDWALEKVEEESDEDDECIKAGKDSSCRATLSAELKDESSVVTLMNIEQMVPTTSSMSSLVDGMACESPHEKMIVDLRDSLFMLLHGKNEKKEMAIGTMEQREMTAAQILFWVANGALHSFEQDRELSPCLDSLSPHIVLFSEHMIVVIALNSGFSSEDSDDSSSVDSSTADSSSSISDCEGNKRSGKRKKNEKTKSSAFEDETIDNESLRWKAPELQWNMKGGATNKSVSFTIGMMLWECLTLQIPFAKYDAETAGAKIKNGERVDYGLLSSSSFDDLVKSCLSSNTEERLSLASLKREFIQHFPPGAVQLTISDAIDIDEVSEYDRDGELVTRTGSTRSESDESSQGYTAKTPDASTTTTVSGIELVPYEQSENSSSIK
ncbi:uncharacterized protein MONOS_7748 [Monocercomonoides exilis]|uniref:uncharacterized protein n=1 Tax=Monocercomonoides exilis TaxID=2049356 RepID=UPI00355AB660|nr:hypothetical protein MONOS_7748 [Monocercomonoides exilis]|eukprot:MONOS_7748.1-p1 / transcript=MONOS_7748.1 / gene=MONOS_7748 / organism=Monocercomonoides_exilis_PA203 / gene_product=unspecified product / transcript_product=unspecified product / location=Mono_scaffold00273:18242-26403(-) / protein_length=2651 / sequence_SO=supercontig / SO=protein_coding / is_pseudo=false